MVARQTYIEIYCCSVSHTADTWNLHIKSVKLDDSGGYVCQVNTDPMKSIVSKVKLRFETVSSWKLTYFLFDFENLQIGYLTVLEPPDFNLEESSTDIVVSESDEVSLVCKASGRPKPHITWKRWEAYSFILLWQKSNSHPNHFYREDGADIVIKDSNGGKFAGKSCVLCLQC